MPDDAYSLKWSESQFVQVINCCLIGTESFYEQVITYRQFDIEEHRWNLNEMMNIFLEEKTFQNFACHMAVNCQ